MSVQIDQIYKQEIAIFKIVKIDRFIWYKLYNPIPTSTQFFWSLRDFPIDKDMFDDLLKTGKIREYNFDKD
jgi:hypothetical protein